MIKRNYFNPKPTLSSDLENIRIQQKSGVRHGRWEWKSNRPQDYGKEESEAISYTAGRRRETKRIN